MFSVVALIKRVLSYAKNDWQFEDYPIQTWKNPNARENKVMFGAGFVNWAGVIGHGETPDAAIAALRRSFNLFKADNGLPRPGTTVKLAFASSESIDRYADLAEDFLNRIFDMNYKDMFISDGIALEYFIPMMGEEEFKQKTIAKIKEIYNVDITDICDRPLWVVLDRIKNPPR
jgi:hypothetical protein